MRKITLFLCLIFGIIFNISAQEKVKQKVRELEANKTYFPHFVLLDENSSIETKQLTETVSNAVYGKLKNSSLKNIVDSKFDYIEVEVPYIDKNLVAKLYRVDVLTNDFIVEASSGIKLAYSPGVYYRGILNDEENSLVSFNFFDDDFNGILSADRLGNVVVGKLDRQGNNEDYIVYSDQNLKVSNDFECHTDDENYRAPVINPAQQKLFDVNTANCVTMYFEIDNNIYTSNNSNLVTTTNWMTSVFNNSQTLYSNDGITVALRSTFVWDTPDPYSGSSSSENLALFYENRYTFNADVGQLIGIDAGGLGGLAAGINGLCTTNNRAYSDVNFSYNTVPTYSWTVQVITHEFGHVLGSRHTHACVWNGNNTVIDGCGQAAGYYEGSCPDGPIPSNGGQGTIMSYCHLISGVGINFNVGFDYQPAQAIINSINAAGCLGSDCVTTCINTVSNIEFSNVSNNGVTVSWDYLGFQNQWQVAFATYPFLFTNWITVNTNSYTTNSLAPNTYYAFKIRPLCTTGLEATQRVEYFATEGDVCGGFVFSDSGGTAAAYANNQHIVRTFTPAESNKAANIVFTNFAVELDYDFMYIYNGADTSAPLLTPEGLTGSSNPGTFTSTASDGSLTVEFISDQHTTGSGWQANVSCVNALGLFEQEYIDYSYYPNPTTGNVTIDARNVINKITVHNAAGQLLYSALPENTSVNVDLAKFATGTYFFSMEVEGVQTHFKVVKY